MMVTSARLFQRVVSCGNASSLAPPLSLRAHLQARPIPGACSEHRTVAHTALRAVETYLHRLPTETHCGSAWLLADAPCKLSQAINSTPRVLALFESATRLRTPSSQRHRHPIPARTTSAGAQRLDNSLVEPCPAQPDAAIPQPQTSRGSHCLSLRHPQLGTAKGNHEQVSRQPPPGTSGATPPRSRSTGLGARRLQQWACERGLLMPSRENAPYSNN